MSLPVAILAGGLATRLRPVTETIPKALVEVAGRPFVEHQLEWLSRQGVDRVVFCLQYRGEMIRELVGDGSLAAIGHYVFDVLRGTGGAETRCQVIAFSSLWRFVADRDLPAIERAFSASGAPA